MTLTFTQKPVDLYVLTLYVGWDAPNRKKFRMMSYSLPVLAMIGIGGWLIGNGIMDPLPLLLLGALGSLSVMLMPRFVRWLQVRRMDQMIAKHPNPKLLTGPRTLHFEHSQLSIQVEDQKTSYPWEGMQEWVELNNHYLLFVRPQVGLIIPRDAFENPEQQEEILDFVRAKIGHEIAFA